MLILIIFYILINSIYKYVFYIINLYLTRKISKNTRKITQETRNEKFLSNKFT